LENPLKSDARTAQGAVTSAVADSSPLSLPACNRLVDGLIKKADVIEGPKDLSHIGLLINKPPDSGHPGQVALY
jgi:hypothetical protein